METRQKLICENMYRKRMNVEKSMVKYKIYIQHILYLHYGLKKGSCWLYTHREIC